MNEQPELVTAERALLGALLLDRDMIAAVVDRITPAAFVDQRNRWTYQAIVRLWHQRIPADPVLVHEELVRERPDIDVGFITGLLTQDVIPVHVEYYAELVVKQAQSRAIGEIGVRLAEAARLDDNLDPAAFLTAALESVPSFGPRVDDTVRWYAELVPDFQETVIRTWDGSIPAREVPTGLGSLDYRLNGGLSPGDLTILAARPGMGKTALALQIAHNAARRGKSVLIFSAEMSTESLLYRATAEMSGITPRAIRDHSISDQAYSGFLSATELLTRLPIAIDDTSGITTDQMITRAERVKADRRLDLIVFDYIELAGDSVKGDNEERRISSISRRLKHMARVLDTPVLALCQLNRGVESRQDKHPILADLRYSGSLEQDADKVLFIYREAYYVALGSIREATVPTDEAEIIVAKYRTGEPGLVKVRFDAATMRFRGYEEP